MKNWQKYIDKQKSEYLQDRFSPNFAADLVVVIPCYNEPNLITTLQSLCACQPIEAKILIAIILNTSVRSSEAEVAQNRKTLKEIEQFANLNRKENLDFAATIFEKLPRKHAGVGLARKIGMDLAVNHFLDTQNPNGIIVSLDADCTVSSNFFYEIFQAYQSEGSLHCTIHNFLHRVESNEPQLEKPIRQYEKYIRYFRNQLRKSGFPYYYHTIGSAFSVSADAYVRVGGMGRQQGGEDFYFLQKIFPLNGVRELPEAFVYPMARYSNRVPFGTGPALQKIMNAPNGQMLVYSRQSFAALQQFFESKDDFFKQDADDICKIIVRFHPSIVQFIEETNFVENIIDCNNNSATLKAFRKRFFHHFNAFKIIKFMNFAHDTYFTLEKISSIEV